MGATITKRGTNTEQNKKITKTKNDFAEFAEWFNTHRGKKRILKIIRSRTAEPEQPKRGDIHYVLSEEILRYDTRIDKFTLYLQKEKCPWRVDSEIGWISGTITYTETGRDDTGKTYEYPETVTISGFLVHDENERGKGYGSILMANFLEYTQALQIETVRAPLSPVDETPTNLPRRNRVYEKYGFIKTNGYYEFNQKTRKRPVPKTNQKTT